MKLGGCNTINLVVNFNLMDFWKILILFRFLYRGSTVLLFQKPLIICNYINEKSFLCQNNSYSNRISSTNLSNKDEAFAFEEYFIRSISK